MASGTIEFQANNYLQGKVEWSSSPASDGSNYSSVTAILYARRTNSYTTTGREWGGYVRVQDAYEYVSFSSSVSVSSSWVEFKRISGTPVWHNEDGSKTVYIGGRVTGPSGTTLANAVSEGGQDIVLESIPRATPTTSVTGTIGHPVTVYINPYATYFRHVVTLTLNNNSFEVYMNAYETNKTVTLPTYFYEQIPNSQEGWGSIVVYTYNGDTFIGSSGGGVFHAYTSRDDVHPLIWQSARDINSTTLALTGNQSKIIWGHATVEESSTVRTQGYSSISSVTLQPNWGNTEVLATSGSDVTNVRTFTNNKNTVFTINATDTRGYTDQDVLSLDMIWYFDISVAVTFEKPTPTGDKMRYRIDGTWWNGNFGAVANAILNCEYRVKEQYGSWSDLTNFTYKLQGNAIRSGSNTSSEEAEYVEITNPLSGDGKWDYQKVYIFEYHIRDRLCTINPQVTVSKGLPIFNIFSSNNRNYLNVNGAYSQFDYELLGIIYVYMSQNFICSNAGGNVQLYFDTLRYNYTGNSIETIPVLYLYDGKIYANVDCYILLSANIVAVKTYDYDKRYVLFGDVGWDWRITIGASDHTGLNSVTFNGSAIVYMRAGDYVSCYYGSPNQFSNETIYGGISGSTLQAVVLRVVK